MFLLVHLSEISTSNNSDSIGVDQSASQDDQYHINITKSQSQAILSKIYDNHDLTLRRSL